MVFAETKRLILRDLTREDLPRLVELFGDWEVVKWLIFDPYPFTQQDAEDLFASITKRYQTNSHDYFVIAEKPNKSLIGAVCVRPLPDDETPKTKYKMFYWLGKPYWSAGYMAEAAAAALAYTFANTAAQSVIATTNPVNQASQNVLSRCGFTYIGIQPRPDLGHLRGSSMMASWELLREDYLRNPPAAL